MKNFSQLFEETLELDELFGFGKKKGKKKIKVGKKAKKVNKKLMKKRSKLFAKNPKKFRPKKPKKQKFVFARSLVKKAGDLIKSLAKKFKLAEMRLSESTEEKVDALASFLDIADEDKEDEIEETTWDTFEAEGGEYMVVTDDEADEAVRRYIEDSIWAFNDFFLRSFMDEETILTQKGFTDQDIRDSADPDDDEDPYHDSSISDDPEEWFYIFMGMSLDDWISEQQQKAESSNDELFNIIDGQGRMQEFVDDAVQADGRGHFLSSYDGEENEEGEFFIYRVN